MIDEQMATIQCQCGEKFQALNQDGTDWDEAATAAVYQAHLKVCPGGVIL